MEWSTRVLGEVTVSRGHKVTADEGESVSLSRPLEVDCRRRTQDWGGQVETTVIRTDTDDGHGTEVLVENSYVTVLGLGSGVQVRGVGGWSPVVMRKGRRSGRVPPCCPLVEVKCRNKGVTLVFRITACRVSSFRTKYGLLTKQLLFSGPGVSSSLTLRIRLFCVCESYSPGSGCVTG